MARPAEPGRTALLQAGEHVLADDGLPALSVNNVVARAGMAKGSFYQHWPARADFLRDLHTRFHDGLAAQVTQVGAGHPPGAERLRAMLAAFLDGCLRQRASKALLVEARTEAGLHDLVQARNAAFAKLIDDDLRALAWPAPRAVAILLIAAAAEVALHELHAGEPLPELRAATLALAARDASVTR